MQHTELDFQGAPALLTDEKEEGSKRKGRGRIKREDVKNWQSLEEETAVCSKRWMQWGVQTASCRGCPDEVRIYTQGL